MKRLKSTYAWVCLIMLVVSCSQDNEDSYNIDTTANALLLKNQQALETNDTSTYGLYHGTVLSATTTSRGKIWVNIANDGNYYALVELVSGEELAFKLKPSFITKSALTTVFEFEGEGGSFIFDVSDINQPQLSELSLNGEEFFSQIVKSYSYNMASSATATFSETGNPSFSGTWSLIADGSVVNPNGNSGDGITSVMVVISGEVFEDFDFDAFDASTCLSNANYIPTLNSYGVPGFTISDYQTTMFANGMTKWNLSYDPVGVTYMNYLSCSTESSGTFYWSSIDGLITKYGDIMLD